MDWWEHEKVAAAEGWRVICGVDEAGRGALAGPVCAAAVILQPGEMIHGLNDSKKLSAAKREALYDIIIEKAVSYAVAYANEMEIDDLNILNATYLAMNRAIQKLEPTPEIALIDGNRANGIQYVSRCIVGGDGKSSSIAAASILAKVSRDRFMLALSKEYTEYYFNIHKGYGTQKHYEQIKLYGPSSVHRQTFLKKMH